MPTILTVFGLRVCIYLNDHRPAHVHVQGHGCEAVFDLHCPAGPPELRENYGYSHSELNKIAAALTKNRAQLCFSWRTLHGHY